jgi:hypothetical protein
MKTKIAKEFNKLDKQQMKDVMDEVVRLYNDLKSLLVPMIDNANKILLSINNSQCKRDCPFRKK